jgi:sugar O-acyltransferase (sialic acid O-acetyltransferase NeuD family)
MKASNKLVIFGTGDFAYVAQKYFHRDSPYEVVAFTVHQARMESTEIMGISVTPFESILDTHPPDQYSMFVAVGFRGVNKARAGIVAECAAKGYNLVSYISPRAICWDDLVVGRNCFILEQNVVQPFVEIGNDVVLWSGNHIGHHVVIEDHCFISSQVVLSGRARIGAYSFIGVNASVRDGIRIGTGCVIGPGSVILKDTQDNEVYAVRATAPLGIPSYDLKSFQ